MTTVKDNQETKTEKEMQIDKRIREEIDRLEFAISARAGKLQIVKDVAAQLEFIGNDEKPINKDEKELKADLNQDAVMVEKIESNTMFI